MITNENSNSVANSMTPGAGVHVLGRGHISYTCIMQMLYFFKNRLLFFMYQCQFRQSKY